MKTLHKDRILAALIIFAIVLFISGKYTISTALFAILVIFLNIKISRNRFKAEELSCD
jgi:membrane protein implicated in regulation of membrane protease activity